MLNKGFSRQGGLLLKRQNETRYLHIQMQPNSERMLNGFARGNMTRENDEDINTQTQKAWQRRIRKREKTKL